MVRYSFLGLFTIVARSVFQIPSQHLARSLLAVPSLVPTRFSAPVPTLTLTRSLLSILFKDKTRYHRTVPSTPIARLQPVPSRIVHGPLYLSGPLFDVSPFSNLGTLTSCSPLIPLGSILTLNPPAS